MRKYGIEHFHIEKVEECDEKVLSEREKYWIEYFGSFKNGYNATIGGDGNSYIDYDLVVATYNLVQNMNQTAKICNIHPDSVSHILKIKKVKIKTSQEVTRDKSLIPVNMYSLDNEYIRSFSSSNDAARHLIKNNYTNCKLTTIRYHISEVCRGKRKTAANFIWKYAT